jgi:hypothetical protein
MRRLACLAVLAATAVAAALTGLGREELPASAAVQLRPCVPARAHVLAKDAVVRVYEPAATYRGEAPSAIYACLAGHRGHMTLLPPNPQIHAHRSLGAFQLAGAVVGYIATQFGVDSGTTTLVVVDVASRRVLRSLEAGHYVDAGFILAEGVQQFLVSPRGSLAWISYRSEHRAPKEYAVHAAAPEQPPRVLDEGRDIGGSSLALAGGTLSWRHGADERSAPLP